MKRKTIYHLFIALFLLSSLSCGNNSETVMAQKKDELSGAQVKIYATSKNAPILSSSTNVSTPSLELVFTDNDIKSFNPESREIVFTDLIVDKLTAMNDNSGIYDKLTFYYGEKSLFESTLILPVVSSWIYNDLVLVVHEDKKITLDDGYPEINILWENSEKERMKKERDLNAQKRKSEWDAFVNYLNESGKLKKP